MNRKKFALLLTFLFILAGCKSGKDVLAIVNGQTIERSELMGWADARKISPDIFKKDPGAMNSMLKQLALEKIISAMATADGFDRSSDYLLVKDVVYSNFITSYYNNRRFRDLKFNEKCADISIIRIFFKGAYGGADYREKALLVDKTIIPALQRGEDFSELAAKYSMDSARTKGGRLGLVPVKMLEENLQPAVLALAPGTYTGKPVLAANSICLIKLERMVDLTEGNIEQYITDRVTRGRINAFVKRQAVEASEKNLENAPGVVTGLSSARFRSDGEFLFSVDNTGFTVGDVKRILKIFYLLKNNEDKSEFPPDEIKITAERILRESVISAEAVRLGYDKDAEFVKSWKYLDRATLTGMYKSSYILQNLKVGKDEVDAWYKTEQLKNKNNRSSLKRPGDRAGIYSQIYRSKFRKFKNEWEAGLLSEKGFAVTAKN